MKYVLDASVAMRWLIPGSLSANAIHLRDGFINKIYDLLAPDIFPAETGSALTKAERQNLIAVGQAAILHGKITNASPILYPYFPLMPRAIEISSQTRSAFYDCLYVALAEREGCELITADDKLVRNLQPRFLFIKALSSIDREVP